MNDLGLNFNPLFSLWTVFLVGASIFGLALVFELRRKQRFLFFRIGALVIVLISILGVLLRPSFRTDKKSGALLLTNGYDKARVDSLVKLNPQLKVLQTDSSALYANAERISSYQRLASENVRYIFGQGLPAFALELMPKSSIRFFPSSQSYGIVELTIPKIVSNRENSVTGVFNSDRSVTLKLAGPTGDEDSVVLIPGKNSFTLSLRPRQPGLISYQLLFEDRAGKKTSERLSVEVMPKRKLRVLFIQNFPSAEVRLLKNFLGEMGHSITVLTRTSKNNFNTEFVNSSRVPLNILTSDLLAAFDLVLIDSKSIGALTPFEKSILEKSVSNGLGLIITDSPFKKGDFYSINTKSIAKDTAEIRVAKRKYILSALPLEVTEQENLDVLLRNKNRILSGYQFFGSGKIGFQLLQETYRVALEGNGEDYSSIWSPLIESTARRQNLKFEVKINTSFPLQADEPIGFCVISSGEKPEVYSDNFKAPLIEDEIIDDYWHGKTWVSKSGWHQLKTIDSIALNYFVYQPSEWKALRAANAQRQTLLFQQQAGSASKLPEVENNPVAPIVFFLLFLLASGFLWLAPKI